MNRIIIIMVLNISVLFSKTYATPLAIDQIEIEFQGDKFERLTMELLEINGTNKHYAKAIDQMFIMLQEQFEGKNIPSKVWG